MLAILDYDAGNIESVQNALRHVGGDPVVVRDMVSALKADRIVFPGVGSAAQCMKNLKARCFDHALGEALDYGKPILAVCIGMQLLFEYTEEDGGVEGTGILPGQVRLFRPGDPAVKVPHMGWNRVESVRPHPLLPEPPAGDDYYFVHSYYAEPAWNDPEVVHSDDLGVYPPGVVYGRTEYAGVRFASAVGKGSLFAAQFHPEKSGDAGLEILRRFLEWDGGLC